MEQEALVLIHIRIERAEEELRAGRTLLAQGMPRIAASQFVSRMMRYLRDTGAVV